MTNSSERKLLQPKKKKPLLIYLNYTKVRIEDLNSTLSETTNGNKKEPYEKASSLIQELQTVMINIP
jgi:hypothetical protein